MINRKYTKKQANYRKAKFTSKNKCGNCLYYKNYRCALLDGYINPGYVCKLHKKNKR